ncbi:hypothetical protein GCM10023215_38300 [Pseudonocardia yuanmonensis]|uniref:Uncharacterized protein n=1 Tax=Pseudonocardia yuanmonensis TaxID=1095914 RepID=A0ABP8WWL2_9PSEU
MTPERTADGRWIVVRGRRRRVDLAKHGLGERGEPWWEQDPAARERRWTEALDALRALEPQHAGDARGASADPLR